MRTVANLTASFLAALSSILTACAHTQSRPAGADCAIAPQPGLYEVTDRRCENPLGQTDYCPLTQYIEIASSQLFDISNDSNVIAFWYAETRDSTTYANEVNVLHGRCEDAHRYLIEHDSDGDAGLLLERGVPVEYWFEGYTQRMPRQLMFRMHLFLRQVARTPELDRRLHIERD